MKIERLIVNNGEHATSVNGTGHPTLQDFIAVGTKIKMNEHRCSEIIDEVRSNCGDLLQNASMSIILTRTCLSSLTRRMGCSSLKRE